MKSCPIWQKRNTETNTTEEQNTEENGSREIGDDFIETAVENITQYEIIQQTDPAFWIHAKFQTISIAIFHTASPFAKSTSHVKSL